MNVRLVVPEVGERRDGIGRYVSQLAQGLEDLGIHPHVVPFRYLPGPSVLRAVPVGVASCGPGIVHFTRIQGASLLLYRRVGLSVVTVHDLGALLCQEDLEATTPLAKGLFNLSLRGMRRASRIIAVSEFSRQTLVSALGLDPDRIDVSPLAVDHNLFRPVENAAQLLYERFGVRTETGSRTMLYVGSEQRRKDLPTQLRALSILKKRGISMRWLKVGSPGVPGEREKLRDLATSLGLLDDITFIDRVQDADLPVFYSAADVYAQSSVWEGFGLPVLEAMACGTPVVSSTAASLPEVAGPAAMMVKSQSPRDFADAVEAIIQRDDLAREMRSRGIEHAARFTWNTTARLTSAAYERVSETEMRPERTRSEQW